MIESSAVSPISKELCLAYSVRVCKLTVVLALALVFLASDVYAAANIFTGTLIQASPFDVKLHQSGFFEIRGSAVPAASTKSLEEIFLKARSFRYSSDMRGDHWQSPAETELRRSGDCEDKAVWLYAELKKQGFSQVRLVIGRFRSFDNKCHVWIELGDPNDALILDAAAQKRIWKRSDLINGFYKPLFSFDGERRLSYKTSS